MVGQVSYHSPVKSLLFEFMRQIEEQVYPVETGVSLAHVYTFPVLV